MQVTSVALIGIGAVGAVGSALHGFKAREIAGKFLKPHVVNATDSVDTESFVTNDMFALVDNLRIICFVLFITSLSLISLGKMAVRLTHRLNAQFSKKVLKRSVLRIAFIVAMLMFAKSYVKECKHIVRSHNGEQKHHDGRKLMSVETEELPEPFIVWPKENSEVSDKELIDTLRDKFEDAEKELENAKEKAENEFAKAKEAFDEEKPSWLKKDLFNFEKDIN